MESIMCFTQIYVYICKHDKKDSNTSNKLIVIFGYENIERYMTYSSSINIYFIHVTRRTEILPLKQSLFHEDTTFRYRDIDVRSKPSFPTV